MQLAARTLAAARPDLKDRVLTVNGVGLCDLVVFPVNAISGPALDVPGGAYDLSPFSRISTAASEPVLAQAMDRNEGAVANLTRPDITET